MRILQVNSIKNNKITLKIIKIIFLEYDECNITELTSQTVKFEGLDIEWHFKVLMRAEKILMFSRDDKYVGFQLVIEDKKPQTTKTIHNKKLFKAEVKLEHSEHKQTPSPNNNHHGHHHTKMKHLTLNDEPDTKVFDYQEITEGTKIVHDDGFCFNAPSYLDGNALVIIVNVWMKTAEVVDSAKKL